MTDPDGTAEHDDLLDRLFPANVTIACIIAAVAIAVGCGLYAWIA